MRRTKLILVAVLAVTAASPTLAEVAASDERGFVSRNSIEVAATPAAAWDMMLRPSEWWSGGHTYSGDAANMTLTPIPGGCFCEEIPGANAALPGRIEHMRVLYVSQERILRMSGGLGPLQGEAVTGVLTMSIEPVGEGARISWEYVVGGYMRMPMAQMAPLVDNVVGEQLMRLSTRLAKGS